MSPEIMHYENGQVESEVWMNEDGDLHRLDGPAYRYWYNSGQLMLAAWRVNGYRHRLDGPAFREWYNNGQLEREEYWINGIEYETEAEFQVAADLYKANEIAELF